MAGLREKKCCGLTKQMNVDFTLKWWFLHIDYSQAITLAVTSKNLDLSIQLLKEE